MASVSPYSVNVSTPDSTKVVWEENIRSPHPWVACRSSRHAQAGRGQARRRAAKHIRQLAGRLCSGSHPAGQCHTVQPAACLPTLHPTLCKGPPGEATHTGHHLRNNAYGTCLPPDIHHDVAPPMLRHLAHCCVLAQAAVVVGGGQLGDCEGNDAQDLAGCGVESARKQGELRGRSREGQVLGPATAAASGQAAQQVAVGRDAPHATPSTNTGIQQAAALQ
jgi:hypothetical protein